MPRSSARWMVATGSASAGAPSDWLTPMQPRPSSLTVSPALSVRVLIGVRLLGSGAGPLARRALAGGPGAGLARRGQAGLQRVQQADRLGGGPLGRLRRGQALDLGRDQFLQRLPVVVV